jgi:hypothetical protein
MMSSNGVLLTSSDSARVVIDGVEQIPVLGAGDDVAIKLDEVITQIRETVADSITTDSELQVELTGSVSFKGSAEAKWLLFKLGGSGEQAHTLKVTLKTTIKPASRRQT